MHDVETSSAWNKKRIFIALFILGLVIVGAFYFKKNILDKNLFSKNPLTSFTKDIKGIETKDNPGLTDSTASTQPLSGLQKAVSEKLETIKQEITTLNVTDIASSSPQFQKVINDLQSLQQYPRNELKDVCQKVCGGF